MASVNQIPERNLDIGHGAQNSLLAYAHRILTAATPFCSLLPPLAALANVPLYTREPLGTGGYGLPRRFAPRNDSPDPLSFRGGPTGRRGNPSFLRWTGVRAAVPRAGPPPAKFRPQHRAAASSAPTKRRDSCRNHPSQRRTAERLRRGREGWAGIGAKTIPKGGPPRDRLGSA